MIKFLQNLFSRKENPVGASMVFYNGYTPPKRDIRAFLTEGYMQNVIVYRCIREIARAVAAVPLDLYDETDATQPRLVDNHLALSLINKPNPRENTWAQFVTAWVVDYLYAGNAYVNAVGPNNGIGQPRELWMLDPRKVKIQANQTGLPQRYEYEGQAGKQYFDADPITGKSSVFHHRDVNPDNYWYGSGALEAAAYSVDVHNQGMKFNKALLENGGAPSFALGVEGSLSDQAYDRLASWKREVLQGVKNAGDIPILEGGLTLQQFGFSPKDLNYKECMDVMARNIASAFGVPFALVIPEAATYSNMADSREAFFENTIIPLITEICKALNSWLMPMFNEGNRKLVFKPNLDGVSALEEKRQRKFDRMSKAVASGLITINEAREELEFERIDSGEADTLLVPGSLIPITLTGLGAPTPDNITGSNQGAV